MTSSTAIPLHSVAIATTLIFLSNNFAQAEPVMPEPIQITQLGMGQTGPLIGGQPGQGGSAIIGTPLPGQTGARPSEPPTMGQPPIPSPPVQSPPSYPGVGSAVSPGSSPERNVVRDQLDRAREQAADIDRDGRISPYEASQLPGATVPPGATVGAPLAPLSTPR